MPPVPRPNEPWYRRLVSNPLFWLTLVLLPLFALSLWSQWVMLSADKVFPDGTESLGLNLESVRFGAFWAMWTALAWVLLFLWLDRFRRQAPLVWLLTFLWGACAATWFSIHVNTWAGQAMSTTDANSDMGVRPAIFAAPWVEEFSKATVLFLLIILFRARIVSRLSIVSLSGLSAIGFAFGENIVYYARALVFVSNTFEIENPGAEVMQLVLMRGLYTSFAHPMFTMMTAMGLAIALNARSKIVRIVAPLAGFTLAAGGHMLFNGVVSTSGSSGLKLPWLMALGLLTLIIIFLILSVVTQKQLIRRRLQDYRQLGWLTDRDVIVFSGSFRRMKLHLAGLLRGPRTWWATAKFMRYMTELAYIREGRTRGTVSVGGDYRAHELIHAIEALRPTALTETKGLRIWPRRKRKPASSLPAPSAPGPAGLGGNWPRRS